MKTLIVYNEYDNGLSFAILDGDLTRFNGVYINSVPPEGADTEVYDELCDELSMLLWDELTEQKIPQLKDSIPLDEIREIIKREIETGEKILLQAVCGFLP